MTLEAGQHTDVFDPGTGAVPRRVADALERIGSGALLLVAGSDARRSGWAENAAVSLGRAWSARRAGVILADLCLDDPVLHDLVGLENDEGVSDVFLFGASLARTVRPVPESRLALLPAGHYTPDSEAVIGHERWGSLLRDASHAQSPLWLYVPATAPGLTSLAERVGQALVLASSEESLAAAGVLPESCSVTAVLVYDDVQKTAREPTSDPTNPDAAPAPEAAGEAGADVRGAPDGPADLVDQPGMDREAVSAAVEAWLASVDESGPLADPVSPSTSDHGAPAEVADTVADTSTATAVEEAPAADQKPSGRVLLGSLDRTPPRRARTGWLVAGVVLFVAAAAVAGWILLGL